MVHLYSLYDQHKLKIIIVTHQYYWNRLLFFYFFFCCLCYDWLAFCLSLLVDQICRQAKFLHRVVTFYLLNVKNLPKKKQNIYLRDI